MKLFHKITLGLIVLLLASIAGVLYWFYAQRSTLRSHVENLLSASLDARVSIESVHTDVSLSFHAKGILIRDPLQEDTLLYIPSVHGKIGSFSLQERRVHFDSLVVSQALLNLLSEWKIRPSQQTEAWSIYSPQIRVEKTRLLTGSRSAPLRFRQIQIHLSDFSFVPDTLAVKVDGIRTIAPNGDAFFLRTQLKKEADQWNMYHTEVQRQDTDRVHFPTLHYSGGALPSLKFAMKSDTFFPARWGFPSLPNRQTCQFSAQVDWHYMKQGMGRLELSMPDTAYLLCRMNYSLNDRNQEVYSGSIDKGMTSVRLLYPFLSEYGYSPHTVHSLFGLRRVALSGNLLSVNDSLDASLSLHLGPGTIDLLAKGESISQPHRQFSILARSHRLRLPGATRDSSDDVSIRFSTSLIKRKNDKSYLFKGTIPLWEVAQKNRVNVEWEGSFDDSTLSLLCFSHDSNLYGQAHVTVRRKDSSHYTLHTQGVLSQFIASNFIGFQVPTSFQGLFAVQSEWSDNGKFRYARVFASHVVHTVGDSSRVIDTLSLSFRQHNGRIHLYGVSDFFSAYVNVPEKWKAWQTQTAAFIRHYFLNKKGEGKVPIEDVEVDIQLQDASWLNNYISIKDFSFASDLLFFAKVQAADTSLQLFVKSPKLTIQGMSFHNLRLKTLPKSIGGGLELRADTFQYRNLGKLRRFRFFSQHTDNKLPMTLSWFNDGEKTNNGYIQLSLERPHVEDHPSSPFKLSVLPSHFFLNDTLWNIDTTTIEGYNDKIIIPSLSVHSPTAHLSIRGTASEKLHDTLTIEVSRFHLDVPVGSGIYEDRLTSRIDAHLTLIQVLKNPILLGTLSLNNLNLGPHHLGNLSLRSTWSSEKSQALTSITLMKKGQRELNLLGNIDPGKQRFDFKVHATNFDARFINPLANDAFLIKKGTIDGEGRLAGTFNEFALLGPFRGKQWELFFPIISTSYFATDTVFFNPEGFDFGQLDCTDGEGGQGTVSGKLFWKNFVPDSFRFQVVARNLTTLNSTIYENETFYGKIISSGNATFSQGKSGKIEGQLHLKAEEGSHATVTIYNTEPAEQQQLIHFSDAEDEVVEKEETLIEEEKEEEHSDYEIAISAQIDPNSLITVNLRSPEGADRLDVRGSSNLSMILRDEGLEMFGKYIVTSGTYRSWYLISVMERSLAIREGGQVWWTGSPSTGQVDVTAVQSLRPVANDLIPAILDEAEGPVSTIRIPVNILFNLLGPLNALQVSYDLEFPKEGVIGGNPIVASLMESIRAPEMKEKQVGHLLTTGSFAPIAGTSTSSSSDVGVRLLSSSISQLASSYLNHTSQILIGMDMGVNYTPATAQYDQQVSLELHKRFFNDRLSVGGNISTLRLPQNAEAEQKNTPQNQWTGNVEASYDLEKTRKLKVKYYAKKRDDFTDYRFGSYVQGLGIWYHKSFDSFKSLFKRKKKHAPSLVIEP